MTRLLEIGLSNAVLATLLAPVALLLGRLSRRPALGHCLWILVLLRLVMPPVVGMPGSSLGEDTAGPGRSVSRHRADPPQPPLAKGGSRRGALPLKKEDHGRPHPLVRGTHAGHPLERAGLLRLPPLARGGWRGSLPAQLMPLARVRWLVEGHELVPRTLALLWLTGSATWFLLAGIRIARFRRLLDHAAPASPELQAEAIFLAERLGLARCPTVRVMPLALSPLVWGLVGGRAWLVLPADLLDRLKPEERSALLAHELAHLRRRDHWVRWLEIAALGLYWWHPVAWWARREIARAEEQCCDAWVVWSLPGAAVAYAKALLKTVDFLSESRRVLPVAASGAGHVRSLKRRVAMILRLMPSPPRLGWPARAGALLLGLLVLPFGPQPTLRAQAPADGPPAKESDRNATRELDRRLRRLEEQLDKLSSRLDRDREKPKAETKAPDKDATKKKPVPGAQPKKETRPKPKPEDEDDDDAMDERAEEFARKIEDWVEKYVDPERLEAMGKKIEEAVKKGIDPERLEAMGKKIEEAVKEGVDPERLGDLSKEIAEAVKEGLDSDRLAEMGEEIAKAVKEGLGDLQDKEKAPKPKAEKPAPVPPPRSLDRETRDLDRRMRELERKLDRLMERLEKQGDEA